jgi:protein-tyrosine-phosphatase
MIDGRAGEELNVLFLCTGNSARSIMAECILNRLGRSKFKGKFKAFSAGSQPVGQVNPLALSVLRKSNLDTAGLRSKSWEELSRPNAPKLDFVFTVCDNAAKEACPVWPGQPMSAHWGLADPAEAEGSEAEQAAAFADCFRMLYQRIGVFVSLPFDRLSRLSLQEKLDEIGRIKADTEKQSA